MSFLARLPLVVPIGLAIGLLLVACDRAGPRPAAWAPLPTASMSDEQARVRDDLLAARDAMFADLKTALLQAMADSGPAGAIGVCRERAPAIAEAVGRDRGVAIGRTSHRLRNPENAPPEWAREAVAARTAEPRWYAHDDGGLAALLPIRAQKVCLSCHGPKDEVAREVLAALASKYPDDRATGFSEGDLRGWFWVESGPTPR